MKNLLTIILLISSIWIFHGQVISYTPTMDVSIAEPENTKNPCYAGLTVQQSPQKSEFGLDAVYYPDRDGDGYGDASDPGTSEPLAGYVTDNTDCDDSNEAVNPGMEEIVGDEIDNDCDGTIDETTTTWYKDADGDGYGDPSTSESAETRPPGYVADNTDCDDTNEKIHPGAEEIPGDEIDNNCDGIVDETNVWYEDFDGDGYGNPDSSITQSDRPAGYVADGTDCNDTNPDIHPGAEEIEDGLDNDCDGMVDETTASSTWYADEDGDGYGDPTTFVDQVDQPVGYVDNNLDCDDTNSNVHPGAEEIPGDGIDNNCDGQVDENGVATTWYEDADGDGYGTADTFVDQVDQPAGYVDNNLDCDDTDANVHPGAEEIADGKDNNCDGEVDEGLSTTWYEDADGDGYGNATSSISQALAPDGYVDNSNDCDDSNSSVHPGAEEIAGDGIDNDCDGNIDETGTTSTWYEDADGDGYGDAESSVDQVDRPAGYVDNNLDCDDTNPDINPDAEEIVGDGIDNNCDGIIDAEGDSDENPAIDLSAQPSMLMGLISLVLIPIIVKRKS